MEYKKKLLSDLLRSPKTVYTFKDISLIWGDTDRSNTMSAASYYIRTGQLYRIRRGIYGKDKNYNRLELATRIFTPSYVSFETVLAKNGVIFQYYERIKIASYLSREISIDNQIYEYKKINDDILTNSVGIDSTKEYSIAVPERAFLDTVYINTEYHFDNLQPLNWDLVFEIVPIYQNKRLVNTINKLYKDFKENS
jgi:predicted transcriptional regulator of viral defense system